MKVVLRNPRREVEVAGGRRGKVVRDDETIELRPVMSGGLR